MLDRSLIERIRTIFLHERACVTIDEATVMLGWSRGEMNAAIAAHEIELVRTCSGEGIERQEVIAQALDRWPIELIEEALGRSAADVLPDAIRTRSVRIRLPRYQVAMLEHLAAERQTTIGHLIAYELEDLAGEHLEDLSSRIAGFAEAFHWPSSETTELPC